MVSIIVLLDDKKDLQKSCAGRQSIKIKNVNGLPKTLKVSFPEATIQNCIVHQIRNSPGRDRKATYKYNGYGKYIYKYEKC